MDGHDLLKQVMKKVNEALDRAGEVADEASAFGPMLDEHFYHPETVVEILDALRKVTIEGEEKALSYDPESDSVSYIVSVEPTGWTHLPSDGPIYYTDTEGNVLKTES